MRINELLEHIENNDHDKLDFDLGDDLLFFMNHDDDVYRRHIYPAAKQFKKHSAQDAQTLFGGAVHEAYKKYCSQFPLRNLPNELPEDIHGKVCDELLNHTKTGHHKE